MNYFVQLTDKLVVNRLAVTHVEAGVVTKARPGRDLGRTFVMVHLEGPEHRCLTVWDAELSEVMEKLNSTPTSPARLGSNPTDRSPSTSGSVTGRRPSPGGNLRFQMVVPDLPSVGMEITVPEGGSASDIAKAVSQRLGVTQEDMNWARNPQVWGGECSPLPTCPKCGTKMTTSGGRTPLRCISASCRYEPEKDEEPTSPAGKAWLERHPEEGKNDGD